MGSNNFSDKFPKSSPALSDVTNRLGKGRFSLVSRNVDHKTGSSIGKGGLTLDGELQFIKPVSLGVENVVNENCRPQDREKCDVGEGLATSDATRSNSLRKRKGFVLDDTITKSKPSSSKGCSRQPKLQGSERFELERCAELKDDDPYVGGDLLKNCSCSFCMKAAHILSDLHYQDIKGRMAALKKSQKETGILVRRSFRDNETGPLSQASLSRSSKLESDLKSQWRSLFLYVEDILIREGNQLHNRYLTVKELRENCKRDLNKLNGVSSKKQ